MRHQRLETTHCAPQKQRYYDVETPVSVIIATLKVKLLTENVLRIFIVAYGDYHLRTTLASVPVARRRVMQDYRAFQNGEGLPDYVMSKYHSPA